MKSDKAVLQLAALAQESRLAVFRFLVQKGPEGLCPSDIQAKLKLAPATLSFHLKELTMAGLLKARQEGRFIYYSPNLKAMDALLSYLTDNCCGGKPCDVACTPNTASANAA
jgi:ArsR family transcriptional regulator, arsenate/arsenite/antimonite-responsive transcriptional repressor